MVETSNIIKMTNIEFAKEICSIKESFEKMYHSIERYDMDKARELYQSYDEFMKLLENALAFTRRAQREPEFVAVIKCRVSTWTESVGRTLKDMRGCTRSATMGAFGVFEAKDTRPY